MTPSISSFRQRLATRQTFPSLPAHGSSFGEFVGGQAAECQTQSSVHNRVVEISRDGPRRYDEWPTDMKRVRDSAFGHSPLTIAERFSRRRRRLAEVGRYPHAFTAHRCWTVRAELNGVLVGYAWAYLVSDEDAWAYIDDVGVHANHQGDGVGRANIDEFVVWLCESGVEHVSGLAQDDRMARIFGHHGITSRPW